VRINKFFTQNGICSRREADRHIEDGRVTINGVIAKLGDQVSSNDKIAFDGKEITETTEAFYIMYNKPRGITCTTDLKIEGNIIDAIKYPSRIFPIGRLDKFSTGLIFLTNDGAIVNQILRAQYGHEKEYEVEVSRPTDDDFLKKMASGVDIGDHITLPCRVKRLGRQTFSVILTEGKNRQIRRMCEALDHRVRNLHRVRIMNVVVGNLKLGQWSNIAAEQLKELKNILAKNREQKTTQPQLEISEQEE
jgi:23S rRNA pseudouridine2604 synthase